MSFSDLGLSEALMRAVHEQGYTTATDIQARAIPVILQGRDVLAGAQTGTGKTAGFTLPLLQRLSEPATGQNAKSNKPWRPVRGLILTPTRELASQVSDSVQTYGKYLPLRSNVVFGGVKISPQIFKLRRGCDILVATPGRLLDLVDQKVLDLSRVEILVLDEADRMLDMGFLPSIQRVLKLVPKGRQSLLFSATYSAKIGQLANSLLQAPVTIEVARRNTVAETISHLVYPVEKDRKRSLLSFLIGHHNWQQVLVFTKTKRGADKLSKQLKADGLRAAAIHGDLTQAARKKALDMFKGGQVTALVATDVAARGIDIQQLSHVINYDLPLVAEDYIHRIGRTGRAGNKGVAISLMGADEKNLLWSIEQLIKREVKQEVVEGYEPNFSTTRNRSKANKPKEKTKRPLAKRRNKSESVFGCKDGDSERRPRTKTKSKSGKIKITKNRPKASKWKKSS